MDLKEAARAGSVEVIEALLKHGADINARTSTQSVQGGGGSVLWWALKHHDEEEEVVEWLKERGAKIFAPGDRHDIYDEL